MGIIITCVVCWLAWKLFERWLFSDNKKSSNATQSSKSESQEQYVLGAVRNIEQAYKISTVYPPEFLKERISNCIIFRNYANELFTDNPKYTICVICNGITPPGEDFSALCRDSNRNNYYASWTFSDSDHGIYDEWPTYDISWMQLKNGVYSVLKKRHPEWKIIDNDTYLSIRV